MVYAGYDFRRAIGFHSDGTPAPLTDEKYVAADEWNEDQIRDFLKQYHSQLANLYFVGDPASFDITAMSGVYGQNPALWPAAYIACGLVTPPGDCSSGIFDAQTSWLVWPAGYGQDPPINGYQGVSFPHVLWHWCDYLGVNPKVMVTHLQKEQGIVKASGPGQTAQDPAYLRQVMGKMLGYGDYDGADAWPTRQVAGGTTTAHEKFVEAPPATPDSPHLGPDHLRRIVDYRVPPPLDCLWKDYDDRFSLTGGVNVPVAHFFQTKAAFALFEYTNYVNQRPVCGGGNKNFMDIWGKTFHFDQ
jgi:hypothetical protein